MLKHMIVLKKTWKNMILLYNVALSDDSKETILYIDTEGANSSLIKFNDNAS